MEMIFRRPAKPMPTCISVQDGKSSLAEESRRTLREESPAGAFHAALLLVLVALFCGCVTKRYHIQVYQYGVNSVGAEVLKEYDIEPQLKVSAK